MNSLDQLRQVSDAAAKTYNDEVARLTALGLKFYMANHLPNHKIYCGLRCFDILLYQNTVGRSK